MARVPCMASFQLGVLALNEGRMWPPCDLSVVPCVPLCSQLGPLPTCLHFAMPSRWHLLPSQWRSRVARAATPKARRKIISQTPILACMTEMGLGKCRCCPACPAHLAPEPSPCMEHRPLPLPVPSIPCVCPHQNPPWDSPPKSAGPGYLWEVAKWARILECQPMAGEVEGLDHAHEINLAHIGLLPPLWSWSCFQAAWHKTLAIVSLCADIWVRILWEGGQLCVRQWWAVPYRGQQNTPKNSNGRLWLLPSGRDVWLPEECHVRQRPFLLPSRACHLPREPPSWSDWWSD